MGCLCSKHAVEQPDALQNGPVGAQMGCRRIVPGPWLGAGKRRRRAAQPAPLVAFPPPGTHPPLRALVLPACLAAADKPENGTAEVTKRSVVLPNDQVGPQAAGFRHTSGLRVGVLEVGGPGIAPASSQGGGRARHSSC